MKLTLNIPDQRIVDLFVSACEGGSNYWCKEVNPLGKAPGAYTAMLGGFTVVDGETGKSYEIGKAQIKKALELFPAKAPNQFAEFLSENDDAATGDCFLQLCVFGDVIYG